MPRARPRRKLAFAGILSAVESAFVRDEAPEHGGFEWIALVAGLDNPNSRAALVWRSALPSALRGWIRGNPGTRPRCWWAFDAPEPLRAVVRGSGVPCATLDVEVGGAAHWQEWSDDLAIESQAAYLRRHRLMTHGESQRVPVNAFEPEPIRKRFRFQADQESDKP